MYVYCFLKRAFFSIFHSHRIHVQAYIGSIPIPFDLKSKALPCFWAEIRISLIYYEAQLASWIGRLKSWWMRPTHPQINSSSIYSNERCSELSKIFVPCQIVLLLVPLMLQSVNFANSRDQGKTKEEPVQLCYRLGGKWVLESIT